MKFRYLLGVSVLFVAIIFQEIPAQSFQTGEIGIVVSNFGRVRVLKDSLAGVRQIDRSNFLAGVNANYVFSYLLSAEPEDSMKNIENPQLSDYEIFGSINNTYDITGESPDFLVKHNVYGWDGGAYALVKFSVINRESGAIDTYLGMEIISQLDGSYGLESIKYLPDSKTISIYREPNSTFVGYKLLSHNMPTLKSIEWYDGYNTSNPDLFSWISYGQIDTLYDSGGDGAVSFFGTEATNIQAGGEFIFWVGISIGDNEAEMLTNMSQVEAKYSLITSVEESSLPIPTDYQLKQNYPNPFNPSTKIQFSIPQSEYVSLKIYDVLGNEVAGLINQDLSAGSYDIQFNANNLSSGIYFYQLITGSYSETKKMNLIK
jgi:hypothetical protein